MWYKLTFLKDCVKDFEFPMPALASVAGKRFNSKLITYDHAHYHTKPSCKSGHSMRSAVYIFNTLCVLPEESIISEKHKIKLSVRKLDYQLKDYHL